MARLLIAAAITLSVAHAFYLVKPSDYRFDAASAYYNDMEYEETAPNNLAVYWTYNDADVGAALQNATFYYSTIVGKSAGHNYVSMGAAMTAGQAIIDVSNLTGPAFFSSVYVVPCENARPDPDGKCRAMWVGPGARLYDVYTYLNSIGYIYPGGSCPIVGISGYALGGGIGFWGRYLGYGTDAIYDFSLWSVQNGKLLNTNKDWVFPAMPRTLRWALQGGGNNNFGIVGNLSLRVFQAPPYVASWVVNSTNTTFCKYLFASRWQYWNWQSDERLWAQYSFSNPFYNITEEKHARLFNGVQLPHWTTFAQSTSVCTITFILMNGTTDELYRIVTDNSTWNFLPIMDQLTFNTTYPTYSTWYDQICGGDLCSDLRPAWQHHWTQGTYSAYQFQDMSDAQVDELFAAMMKQPDPNTVQSFVLFDSLGGQFSRGTGSLPWHAAHYHAQILYYLWPVGDRGQKENGWVWASGVGGVLDQNAPQPQGSSYVNYPDWSYASPQLQLQRYYGPNLPTLQTWKKFLDPGNLFPSTAGVNLDGTLNALGKAATPEPLRDDDDNDDDSLFGKFFNAVLNLFNALF